MNKFAARFLTFTSAVTFSGVALGSGQVILTLDAHKSEPTIVSETNDTKRMEFVSVDYYVPGAPESFKLIFEAAFKDQFFTGPIWTPGVEDLVTGEWIFESATKIGPGPDCKYKPPSAAVTHDCQHVLIKLKNAPGATSQGFLYRVEMGGRTLDPRLRSR